MKKIMATPAGAPKIWFIKYVGWVMSAYLAFICISQFAQAAKSAESVLDYATKGEIGALAFIAVFAIPFLSGMKVSKLMRFMSMAFGWMMAALLFVMAVMQASSGGIVGDLAQISFAVLMLIVTWGYWPFRGTNPKKTKKTKKVSKTPKH
ncbi:MAG: hypothetical protein LBG75_01590 [Candidatus Nomurabacteria bacterium]|jgi:hypothetical protein|nr:hypothetical protein [Candidatus Nomurabacteria bacterium]